jgi:hypothetical protein
MVARQAFSSIVPTMQRGDSVVIILTSAPKAMQAVILGDDGAQ